ERIADVCAFAKSSLGFDFLLDITSVDNYGDDPRFTLVYELYGLGHRRHLRLKTDVSEENCEIPTVTTVWRTANWHEPEIYVMIGCEIWEHFTRDAGSRIRWRAIARPVYQNCWWIPEAIIPGCRKLHWKKSESGAKRKTWTSSWPMARQLLAAWASLSSD